jgi:hypothetical protein
MNELNALQLLQPQEASLQVQSTRRQLLKEMTAFAAAPTVGLGTALLSTSAAAISQYDDLTNVSVQDWLAHYVKPSIDKIICHVLSTYLNGYDRAISRTVGEEGWIYFHAWPGYSDIAARTTLLNKVLATGILKSTISDTVLFYVNRSVNLPQIGLNGLGGYEIYFNGTRVNAMAAKIRLVKTQAYVDAAHTARFKEMYAWWGFDVLFPGRVGGTPVIDMIMQAEANTDLTRILNSSGGRNDFLFSNSTNTVQTPVLSGNIPIPEEAEYRIVPASSKHWLQQYTIDIDGFAKADAYEHRYYLRGTANITAALNYYQPKVVFSTTNTTGMTIGPILPNGTAYPNGNTATTSQQYIRKLAEAYAKMTGDGLTGWDLAARTSRIITLALIGGARYRLQSGSIDAVALVKLATGELTEGLDAASAQARILQTEDMRIEVRGFTMYILATVVTSQICGMAVVTKKLRSPDATQAELKNAVAQLTTAIVVPTSSYRALYYFNGLTSPLGNFATTSKAYVTTAFAWSDILNGGHAFYSGYIAYNANKTASNLLGLYAAGTRMIGGSTRVGVAVTRWFASGGGRDQNSAYWKGNPTVDWRVNCVQIFAAFTSAMLTAAAVYTA